MINFPSSMSEDDKLQICKLLDDKDKELSAAYKEIVQLENKLERFNGSLTWKESEALKTAVAVNNGILEQVKVGLKNYNLRYVECPDAKSPHAFPVQIQKITLFERLSTWVKGLFRFKIVRSS